MNYLVAKTDIDIKHCFMEKQRLMFNDLTAAICTDVHCFTFETLQYKHKKM